MLENDVSSKFNLLCVHGAWHTRECWKEFLSRFGENVTCNAPDLPGHGEANSANAKALYALGIGDYVAEVVRRIAACPVPPVVIGHSLGAYVVQTALARHPEAVVAGQILMAPSPVSGCFRATLKVMSRESGRALWDTLWSWRETPFSTFPLVGTAARARDLFFDAKTPLDTVQGYLDSGLLQDESLLALVEQMFPIRGVQRVRGKFPTLVIRGSADAVFTEAEAMRTAKAWGGRLITLEGVPHDIMLDASGSRRAAEAVLLFLDEVRSKENHESDGEISP